jgi:hypothetical protein
MPEYASELTAIIHQVRRRWRRKLAVRGTLAVLAIGFVVFLASASALEAARFTPGAILIARIGVAIAIAALVALFFVRPLLRRVTDEQVALYLEEHEPSLQEAIISAVEASRAAEASDAPHSRALVRKLVESAVRKSEAVEHGRRVEQQPVRRYSVAIALTAAAALLLLSFGPAFLRNAASAMLVFSRDVEASVPYRIDVQPGNATVSRGADQVITAQLSGFDAEDAALMIRKGPDAEFERVPMIRADNGGYDGMLFDLTSAVDYYVEAEGVRSGTFTLKVVELPYVQKLELEYHFPSYTGLPPQKIEDGGDIAVLRGTEVRVRAVPTMATGGGQIVIEKGSNHGLTPAADGALTGSFKVDKDGLYHLEMDAPTGERVNASPQYTIDVLVDGAPTVSIAKPGRDTQASPIEEVFVEARADDDYGVKNLELVYSVNGGDEKTVRLFNGQNRMPEVSAGHTFYLEELDLKPGDFVSYYARATDNDAVSGAKPATSDIYFMRIRPLSKDFRRAQSQASGGGGGGGGQQDGPNNLSEQQKKIIAATFNVQRDRKTMTAGKLAENTRVVALSQEKLRTQVEELVLQLNQRLGGDEAFKRIIELLPKAITEMKAAEAKLQAVAPAAALTPEQKALQYLQQAEEEFETQVQMRQQQGGGGGGGGQQQNRDLSELFELEVDRMANQYEMRQQAAQQQADQKIDEIAEKLKELARRQEQEAERQRRRAAAGQQQSGGGSGASQRELAEQVEQAARQLEQLAREQNRPELERSAQQLRQSADAMRRAAANGEQAGGAQSAEALERLRQAEQQLARSQSGRPERDVSDAIRRAEEIAKEQKDIADEVRGLPSAAQRDRAQVQQLLDRKGQLEQQVTDLEKQIDRAAANMRRDERDASRRMSEAADGLRDNRVRDKIRYSGALVRSGMSPADTENFEREIGSNLQSLRDKLGEAQKALGNTRPDPQATALERAGELARNIESLGERARERQQGPRSGQADQQTQGRQGQQGDQRQQGDQSQQGQDARASEQRQQGQRGQQGQQDARGMSQQDQQGQSGQQGQQGQQGQGQQGQQGQSGQQGQQGQQGQSGQQGQQGQGGQQGQQGQAGQQGQGGQQGDRQGQQQGGQGGQNQGDRTQDGRGGDGDTTGAPQLYAGGGGDRRPGSGGRISPEDARQFRAEIRQLTQTAEGLRRTVGKEDQAAVADMLKKLKALDSDQVFKDPAQFDRLHAQAADAVKRFEFNLRRRMELKGNEVLLSGDGDVPEEFRKLVEQYYKSLSKGSDKK